jgi:hypothetical protein
LPRYRPERTLEVHERQRHVVELGEGAVIEPHVFELEDHVEFEAVRTREQDGIIHGHPRHLTDRDQLGVAPREDLAIHLPQVVVDLRTHHHLGAGADEIGLPLRDVVDHVHAESVDAAVEPPVHHGEDRRAHLGVLPVEVGLLRGEQVQVILAGLLVQSPGRPAEGAAPEVWFATVVAVAPDIPVPFRVVAGGPRLREPRVLVARVVHDEVHHEFEAAVVHLGQEQVELGEGSEERIDVPVIADVVTVVGLRRAVDGGEPHDVHSELLQVVEPASDAAEVADAIAVRIGEASRVDLVDHRVRPPWEVPGLDSAAHSVESFTRGAAVDASRGTAAISARVYSCRGASKTAVVGPASTTRPARITSTSSLM